MKFFPNRLILAIWQRHVQPLDVCCYENRLNRDFADAERNFTLREIHPLTKRCDFVQTFLALSSCYPLLTEVRVKQIRIIGEENPMRSLIATFDVASHPREVLLVRVASGNLEL